MTSYSVSERVRQLIERRPLREPLPQLGSGERERVERLVASSVQGDEEMLAYRQPVDIVIATSVLDGVFNGARDHRSLSVAKTAPIGVSVEGTITMSQRG